MNKKAFALIVAVTTFSVGILLAKISLRPAQPKQNRAPLLSKYELSGPYTHKNLTIFLIHGADESDRLYIPLQEALERKQVVVYETKDVNELAIENLSSSDEVLVQSGDIVKGGQQDRVLAVDLILPAHSGKTPIDAFCVENGRWQQRGAEQVDQFSISSDMVSTRDLKLATKASDPHQAKVWEEVARAQGSLSRSVGTGVAGVASPSSLQLALEHEKVQDAAADYLQNLSSIVEGKSDAIGYVFAINQKLNSADVYSSSAVFKRFWPRLLKASAIEAVAERFAYDPSGEGPSRVDESEDAVSLEGIKGAVSLEAIKRTAASPRLRLLSVLT
jgi:hypothetical protein